jgi:hypothetical protein
LRIVINVPENFRDDEIIINLNREEPLPFSDGVAPEEIEELTLKEQDNLNAYADYITQNMYGGVEIYEVEEPLEGFGGDIEVG